MRVVYDEKYREVYSSDPAAMAGRIECVYEELRGDHKFVKPRPATEEELRLVHGERHINSVKRSVGVYEIAALAAGGAIEAGKLAIRYEPAFGLIRPPGHHASRDSSWGFCYFNNIAISIERLRMTKQISRATIVDIDLHYGDGTANIFAGNPDVSYCHIKGESRQRYLDNLGEYLETQHDCEVIAVSAGFDRHEQDWGGLLRTEDYLSIGKTIKEFAENACGGRRYAVLEGGYNLQVLGKNVKALLVGMG